MPWLSSETCALPQEDVVSFALRRCDYDPDQPIYHDLENPSRTLSWRQARTIVRKLVAGFRRAGLRKGDCFGITAFNDIMYSMCFLAGIGAGGIFSGMNPAYQVSEIRHHIRTAEVKFFLVEPSLLPTLVDSIEGMGISTNSIFIFNPQGGDVPAGFRSWEWLLGQGEEDWLEINDAETLKNTELARLTTSGTTGLPKFALQSHYNATSFHHMVHEARQTPFDSRQILVLPSFHVASVPGMHVSPLRSGHAVWIMRRFELEAYLAAIEKFQINSLSVAPPFVMSIINSPLRKKYSLRSIRVILCGAAPLDAESQGKLRALCAPDCGFTQVWGMTETTSALSLFRYPEQDDTGSIGSRFLPNTDVKLIDDDGKDITDFDTRGELCVRGPTVVKGYFKNPKANTEGFDEEGYLKTGDIVYCDGKTKKWYIVDRKKELIKVRGFQVAPTELESVLLGHPDVEDCAVIGVDNPQLKGDEKPRAYVVRRPGATVGTYELQGHVSNNLASYKALTGGVVFVNEIPRSPSGKILKRILREQAASSRAKL